MGAVADIAILHPKLRFACLRIGLQSPTQGRSAHVTEEQSNGSAMAPAEVKERLEQALFEIRRVIAGQDAMLECVVVCLLV